MSKLTNAQCRHSERISELKLIMISFGYDVAESWGYRNETCNSAIGGHSRSLHMMRMANDIILRDRETGDVLDEKDHLQFHKIWEEMGGNRMIDGDSGHYSSPWGNML